MAHSLHYQIGQSIRAIEAEVVKLLSLAAILKEAGSDELAWAISKQANRLIEAAVGLRIAMAG